MNVEEKLDNAQIKHLSQDISNLSINEMKEVFKILDKNAVKYTENSNGIYFILTQVPNDVLLSIKKFLAFCQTNKETLDSIDNAQMYEKQNMDKNIKEIINTNTIGDTNGDIPSGDTKYVAKITHQNELDKYGLNLDEEEAIKPPQNEEIDLALHKAKIKYTGIKSKIIKTSKSHPKAKPAANKDSASGGGE